MGRDGGRLPRAASGIWESETQGKAVSLDGVGHEQGLCAHGGEPRREMDHWLLRVTEEKGDTCIGDPGLHRVPGGWGDREWGDADPSSEGVETPMSKHLQPR